MSSDTPDRPYQVMPELSEEKRDRLKADIRENGIEYPIIYDPDGEIIDGHHRYEIWVTELGRDPDDLPTRTVDDTDTGNYHRAYRTNLLRRDLTDGTKREVVKQYLCEHPDRVAEDTQADIASDLGVSQQLISDAVQELRDSGKLTTHSKLSTEEKRQQVREFVEDNPTASDRETARSVECEVSHVTVGNWREEWDIEQPTTELDAFANDKSGHEQAAEVAQTAVDREAEDKTTSAATDQIQKLNSGEVTPENAKRRVDRTERKQQHENAETPDLPPGEYDVLYADPPWDYNVRPPDRPTHPSEQYGVMSDAEIQALDVPAADDAVLYLWATAPRLPAALAVMDSWGFEYKTGAVWDKQSVGVGYWWRGQHEHLLVGVRGDMSPPAESDRRSSVFEQPRTGHSEKPDSVAGFIESAFPPADGHRLLELFARESREGWDAWGDEV